jgi:hypothetical protein
MQKNKNIFIGRFFIAIIGEIISWRVSTPGVKRDEHSPYGLTLRDQAHP